MIVIQKTKTYFQPDRNKGIHAVFMSLNSKSKTLSNDKEQNCNTEQQMKCRSDVGHSLCLLYDVQKVLVDTSSLLGSFINNVAWRNIYIMAICGQH